MEIQIIQRALSYFKFSPSVFLFVTYNLPFRTVTRKAPFPLFKQEKLMNLFTKGQAQLLLQHTLFSNGKNLDVLFTEGRFSKQEKSGGQSYPNDTEGQTILSYRYTNDTEGQSYPKDRYTQHFYESISDCCRDYFFIIILY